MAERKLNWRQACTTMGCGKDKFYELIRTGRLKAYRVGERGLWVKEDDVQRLIEPIEPDDGGAGMANAQNSEGFVG